MSPTSTPNSLEKFPGGGLLTPGPRLVAFHTTSVSILLPCPLRSIAKLASSMLEEQGCAEGSRIAKVSSTPQRSQRSVRSLAL